MKKTDALWLLASPIYLIIGTGRHELSHAAVAALQGARITELRILPSIRPQLGFLWGYVHWIGGQPTWITMAAPYFCDLIVFGVFMAVCSIATRMPRWLWINCFAIGLASPLVNTLFNYQKVFTRGHGDVNDLMALFPRGLVHFAFLAGIALYTVGIWSALGALRRAQGKDE